MALAGGFDRWNSQVQTFMRQRELLERVLLRMKNRAIAVALEQWAQQVATFMHQRDVLDRILLRMQNMAANTASGCCAAKSDLPNGKWCPCWSI